MADAIAIPLLAFGVGGVDSIDGIILCTAADRTVLVRDVLAADGVSMMVVFVWSIFDDIAQGPR